MFHVFLKLSFLAETGLQGGPQCSIFGLQGAVFSVTFLSRILKSYTELEFLKSLWGLGTEEE
jgi:hypothetical protein